MANDLKLRVLLNMIDGATRPLKNILSGNRELAKSVKDSRDQLKELGRVQKDVASFREMRAGLQTTSTELAAAQNRVNQLAATLRSAGPPTKAMVREFEQAKATSAKLKAAHEQQQAQLLQLRSRLSGAGIDTRNLSQNERELRANIDATNAAMTKQQAKLTELATRERKLAEARAKMQATQETAGRLAGTGAGMMAAGGATSAPVVASVSAYAKAEESATNLQAALMRAGGVVPPEFQKINDLAMKLGDRLPGTTSDFQDMMTMLTRQGISAKSILGGMGEATAYLAVQLKKTPAEAAEFAAKLQDATRTSENDMMALMDVIQKSFYLGVDDSNMLQGFTKLSPAMDTLRKKGIDGAKTLAPLLVMLDQAGMKGEASGNALRKVFQSSLDTKRLGKANDLLGPGLKLDFSDGKGEFGGLDKLYQQLDKLKGLTSEKRLAVIKELFGDDAETLQAVALLMEKGTNGYAEVQAKMDAQASMQERVNKQLGTLRNLWEATSGTFTNGLVALGESIAPEVKAVTIWLGDMAQAMGSWARENPKMAGAIMKTVAVVGLLLTAGGALTLMLASVLGPMALLKFSVTTLGLQGGIMARVFSLGAGALRLVGHAAMFIGRALLMNPIGASIAAIAAAAYLIYRYWEPIKAFFAGLWTEVRSAFAGGIGGIAALFMNWSPLGLFYKAFATALSFLGVEMPAKFTEFGANLLSGLVNGITSRLGAVKDAIVNAGSSAVGWFKEKLGINSPSRVFGELGGFITQGAAIGMEGEQGRLAKAAAGLAMVATTSFGTPAIAQAGAMPISQPALKIDSRAPISARQAPAAASGGGDQYIFNINGAQDPQAIRKQIEEILEKRDRAKQSRIGSRLTD